MIDLEPLFLTLKLAGITTVLLFFLGIPMAYWLAFSRFRYKGIIEALISMPLVLPPTVLGFYLLLLFSPNNGFGAWLNTTFGLQLAFSFHGLVVASILYSLPFMVYPILSGLKELPVSLREAAYTLGKKPVTVLLQVLLPNIKPSLLIGLVLSFAHTIGEFGVVLMIGGKIPGETKVASISIYDAVEGMRYQEAHLYAFLLFLIAFFVLSLVYWLNGRMGKSGIL